MSPNNASSGKSNEVISAASSAEAGAQGPGPPAEGPRPAPVTNRSRGTVRSLMGELLGDIYGKPEPKRRTSVAVSPCGFLWQHSDCSGSSGQVHAILQLMSKDLNSLKLEKKILEKRINDEGHQLIKQLKRKNFLQLKREAHCDLITAYIQAISSKTREDTKMKFSLSPGSETGFSQWLDAMKMVAQLPGGMPSEFRTKLWLLLSEKHLNDQKVDWEKAETVIFNEWTNPDDEELGVQIVKDLHRTGCSLFCGEQEHNQALLKRVLLAYARWNKNVGYCQGFNMLAALILQVMDKDEKSAVKVMIYLIEGVLPESYFANNLRGLSVDMAVFRDLLRLRLPKLSKHLEALQHDISSGTNYEPPLTNVFTMQWFLTLFSNCLPQQTVLRVWDLVFLYGNEVLLRTALAIWAILQDRVISVESADEFYSIMGVVTREMLEFGLMDANTLIKRISMVDPFPNELQELREKYLYNISPWTQSVQCVARKGIKLFYSDAEEQDDTEDEDKIALTTAYGVFRRRESSGRELQLSSPTLDIGILKQQYAKLRQRQRQAHVIITAACSSNLRSNIGPGPSVSVNHLLMGKSALVNKGRRIGPPEGSIPPINNTKANVRKRQKIERSEYQHSYHWEDIEETKSKLKGDKKKLKRETNNGKIANDKKEEKQKTKDNRGNEADSGDDNGERSNSSSSTELCDSESDESDGAPDPFDWGPQPRAEQDLDVKTQELVREETQLPIHSEKLEPVENSGCDNTKLLEIKKLAMKLVNDIEDEIQTESSLLQSNNKKKSLENMATIPNDFCIETQTSMLVQSKQFDNTDIVISSLAEPANLIRCDNTINVKPEVPRNPYVIENLPEERKTVVSAENGTLCRNEQSSRKKSELGLNVIRENLQILHKFSALRNSEKNLPQLTIAEKKNHENETSLQNERPQIDKPEGTEEKEEQQKWQAGTGFAGFQEAHSPMFNRKGTPSIISSEETREKVNKEVNTEITFGAEKLESQTGNEIFCLTDKFNKDFSLRSEKLLRIDSQFLEDRKKEADEIKAKMEVSKNDWDLKMKRIAELESTTREALDEMQVHSPGRKWHGPSTSSIEPEDKSYGFYSEEEPLKVSIIKPETGMFSPRKIIARKTEISHRSFDAITSRTEELLGNVAFSRSTDGSFSSHYLFPEVENRKSPRYSSDANKTNSVYAIDRTRSDETDFRFTEPASQHRLFSRQSRLTESDGGSRELERKGRGERLPAEKKDVDSYFERQKFNPFPTRTHPKPKELGMKLGLYPTSPDGPPKKA